MSNRDWGAVYREERRRPGYVIEDGRLPFGTRTIGAARPETRQAASAIERTAIPICGHPRTGTPLIVREAILPAGLSSRTRRRPGLEEMLRESGAGWLVRQMRLVPSRTADHGRASGERRPEIRPAGR